MSYVSVKYRVVSMILSAGLLMICRVPFPVAQAKQTDHKKPAEARAEEGYVATDDGTRLFYQKTGNGPQKVIIPGRLFLFDDFKQLASGRTLVFYDMRGRGRSDRVPEDQKSRMLGIHHDVKDVEAVRRHFGFERFSLIGYSYLGLMTVMYAMEHPRRVERIIQMGPVPIKFGTEYPKHLTADDEKPVPALEEIENLRKLQRGNHHNTHPKEYCEQEWSVTRFRLVGNPANVEKLGKSKCDMPNEWPANLAKHFEHSFASVQRLRIAKEQLAKVTAPVLTIHGTKDRNAVYGAGREWAFILPNARLLTIAGAAHAAYVEAPQVIFPAIDAFLNGKWPDNVEKVKAIDTTAKTK
jgi:proline iminopeptidase